MRTLIPHARGSRERRPSSLMDRAITTVATYARTIHTRKHALLIASQLRRVTTIRHYAHPSRGRRTSILIENYKRTPS